MNNIVIDSHGTCRIRYKGYVDDIIHEVRNNSIFPTRQTIIN